MLEEEAAPGEETLPFCVTFVPKTASTARLISPAFLLSLAGTRGEMEALSTTTSVCFAFRPPFKMEVGDFASLEDSGATTCSISS